MPTSTEEPPPLPVLLMSTIWADGEGAHDDLGEPADLGRWLDAAGLDRAVEGPTERDLARARSLRDALRRLAAHVTADRRPATAATTSVADALDQVNAIAAELPAPRLALRDGRLERG